MIEKKQYGRATEKKQWEIENELARSMGFTCTIDYGRGGREEYPYSRFNLGPWTVWQIVSPSPKSAQDSVQAWQVAHVAPDGTHSQHYTKAHLKPGEFGMRRCGIIELKDALEYAKARHEEDCGEEK
jgi:hypothetical protein